MISPDWKRIAAIEVIDDGSLAGVWIAVDSRSGRIHLYDCCKIGHRPIAVIAERITEHARWIPVAWEKSATAMADKLKERGCNMTFEPYEENDALAEVIARDIETRMDTGRFLVEPVCAEWIDEYKQHNRRDQKVPREGFPLMTATRFACAMFDEWAKPEGLPGATRRNHPNVPVT